MENAYTITHNGRTHTVQVEPDITQDYPWDREDGHGPVRQSRSPHYEGRSDKAPGERPLNHASRLEYQFYYDWAAAVRLAKHDGWDIEPFGQPDGYLRAVEADFQRLRRFLANDWEYVGVVVTDDAGRTASLWGIESDCTDYLQQVAHELADELEVEAERHTFPVATMGI